MEKCRKKKKSKKEDVKDLTDWLGKQVKVIPHEDGYYEGILRGELNAGLLIESKGKRVYIQYDSITAIEEL